MQIKSTLGFLSTRSLSAQTVNSESQRSTPIFFIIKTNRGVAEFAERLLRGSPRLGIPTCDNFLKLFGRNAMELRRKIHAAFMAYLSMHQLLQ